MPPHYLSARRGLFQQAATAAQQLDLRPETLHDGLLLLDRAMSRHPHGLQGAEELQAAALVCVQVAAQQSIRPERPLGSEAMARAMPAGAEAPQRLLHRVEVVIADVLGSDTAAVSSLRCLKLYLERLGYAFLQDGTAADGTASMESCQRMLLQAAAHVELLRMRPSAVAAAVLARSRRTAGHHPFWPTALRKLTGYNHEAGNPELRAAIECVERLPAV
mmetsp:Transcript_5908/g.15176  ORF Transcript_5908/g.15176 Transcript_5908/m.15176 type:complete len:219 (-) Transcript_5908:371-1027(-)